jgi:hypothetical protein
MKTEQKLEEIPKKRKEQDANPKEVKMEEKAKSSQSSEQDVFQALEALLPN